MPQDEGFHGAEIPQAVWMSEPEGEKEKMEGEINATHLFEMAQASERLNTRLVRVVYVVALAVAAALLYNVFRLDEAWIRLGQAWILGVVVLLFLNEFPRRRQQSDASVPCAVFLQHGYEEKRRGLLRIRSRLFLFLPGIAACWWGGRSLAAAQPTAAQLHSWPYVPYASPWPFLAEVAILVFVWFAFGKAAEKAARERDEIVRTLGG